MAERFFLDTEIVDGVATLQGDQAHHASNVMRLNVDDRIQLFDGRGTVHQARIIERSKKQLVIRIECTSHESAPEKDLTIAAALPKGDRQRFMVEKLTELGVSRLIPLDTARSVSVAKQNTLQKLRKYVVEASKQCRRNHLMEIGEPQDVAKLSVGFEPSIHRFIADPAGRAWPLTTPNASMVVAIGPEGGFTQPELEMLTEQSWQSVCLSPHLLRIETAAITAAVMMAASASSVAGN